MSQSPMPLKPKALSPSCDEGLPVVTAAPMAYPIPMPITPHVPVSIAPRFVHIDDVASKIGAVCPFVYDVGHPFSECVPDLRNASKKLIGWVGH